MDRILRFLCVVFVMVFFMGVSSMAEEITLTTYYPAPYGNYEELQATMLAVGSATTMPASDGTINAQSYEVDGTAGWTGTITYLRNLGGATGTITVDNGIITNAT